MIENLAQCDWELGEHEWDVSSLWMIRPGEWHAVWVSWLPDGSHHGWYVNLQRPFRRTAIGIEAMDLMLDIVVEPDLRWRWKDEEEFDEMLARRIMGRRTGLRVRREAEVVVNRIERRCPPFSEPWPTWEPDPSWPVPELGDGWDHPQE